MTLTVSPEGNFLVDGMQNSLLNILLSIFTLAGFRFSVNVFHVLPNIISRHFRRKLS